MFSRMLPQEDARRPPSQRGTWQACIVRLPGRPTNVSPSMRHGSNAVREEKVARRKLSGMRRAMIDAPGGRSRLTDCAGCSPIVAGPVTP